MSSEIELVTSTPNEKASWVGLRDLARIMPTGWSLAGGTLVRLHGVERDARFPRATTDILNRRRLRARMPDSAQERRRRLSKSARRTAGLAKVAAGGSRLSVLKRL